MFKQTEEIIKEAYNMGTTTNVGYTWIKHGKVAPTVWMGTNRPEQLYDLASLTKIIGTVPAILRVLKKHQLTLDTKVNAVLPEVVDDRVLIRHLITHTSGAKAWIDHRDDLNASELRSAIYRELSFGDDFNRRIVYNDYNYLLLGFIIEKLEHESVQNIITRDVIQPLGLKHTTFKPSALRAVPTEVRDGIVTKGTVHDPKAFSLGEHAASAGLFAPMDDIVRFTKWMMSDGGEVLTSEQMNAFGSNQTGNNELKRSLGWAFSQKDNRTVLRHSGFTGTFILLDRMTQNGLVFLSSRVYPHPNLQFLDFRQAIYAEFEKEDV